MGQQIAPSGRTERREGIRPVALAMLALGMAYGGGLWLHILHEAAGASEPGAPAGVVHWLRDSTLALPIVLVAVWLGLRLGARIIRPYAGAASPLLTVATTAAVVASVTSLALALASPLHGLVFGGHHDEHGVEMPLAIHMIKEGVTALAANLAIAALVILALRGQVFSAPERIRPARRWFESAPLRRAFALTAGVTLLASSGVVPRLDTAAVRAADPIGPCPVTAPLKSFDVSAIDVVMRLDRFGTHDPLAQMYVLDAMIPAVRAEEAEGRTGLSIGLRDDAIQPLAIRANQGDCVQIRFTNRTTRPAPQATDNTYGIHIDGVAFEMSSSGDAVGNNPASSVPAGGTATYAYWIPDDRTLEGAHYLHPGAGNRQAVAHGLFGALIVEPPGSTYRNPTSGLPQLSGWEADIIPATGKAFRENVKIFHEIGNESETDTVPLGIDGLVLPTIDPHTDAYRPGTRAINYRSEPFMARLNFAEDQKSTVYSSYTFGDTTNLIARGYLGDPTKFRIVHAGSEVFHIYHLHGGADRWHFNPKADPTSDYGKTGLNKRPTDVQSESARIDSQSMGPGESFDLEIENGAGGGQQGAGEFLFHCHIAHHYFAGMWGAWRVFDTLQPDLMPLPARTVLPQAVDSSGLLNRTIAGQAITAQTLDAWIRPQLPPPGVTRAVNPATGDTADQDASVWDWTVDGSTGIYLGEPDRPSNVSLGGQTVPWPNFANTVPGHPSALIVDQVVQSTYQLNGSPVTFNAGGYVGTRPKLLFNPANGRPAFPMLRPHIGKRPPFSPNGHSGAPYLGEDGNQAPVPVLPLGTTSTKGIDPWANRSDGICPAGAPLRTYNVVGIPVPIQVTNPAKSNQVDQGGALLVLAEDKEAIYAGTRVYAGVRGREPLAIRANIGDCVALTYASELTDGGPEVPFSKTNIHIHHVQFDTQASDGVISGFSYEQSIRPYKVVDPQLTSASGAGATELRLSSVAKFQPGVWIAVGLGTEGIEIRQISSINTQQSRVTLTKPLGNAHPAGQWAGTEFVQYRWYPDAALDNVFFHDHVNGIHGWSHGMVGQLIVEPEGSTYHDPVTGEEIRAGAVADIRTDPACVPRTTPSYLPPGTSDQCVLIPGVVPGAYREFALWTINDGTPVEATMNLRAEPWTDRGLDPTKRFSSLPPGNGDPFTPILKAYVGDPVVIRNINVGQGTNTLTIDGHQTYWEPRYRDAVGGVESSPVSAIHTGVSERFTLILKGGAGGPNHVPGDYLYHDGENRRFQAGAWGLLRVLPNADPSLQPLPGYAVPPPQEDTCPSGAPVHAFAISAVDLPSTAAGGGRDGRQAAFVRSSQAAAVRNGTLFPEPLVLHVAAGECVQVTLNNERALEAASFNVRALLRDLASSGVNVGNNAGDQTVPPGGTRTYTYYADTQKLESTAISDFGGANGPWDGLYGSLVVAPAGSTFTDPRSGQVTDVGTMVDVHVPGKPDYRDFTLILADQDPRIGQETMPYPRDVSGPALVNYRQVLNRPIDAATFSSTVHGDPTTPLLLAYAGDPVKVHVLGAPMSEQVHVFNLGGMSWAGDMYIHNASQWQSRAVGPWEKLDINVSGGAGGVTRQPGDYFYGDIRRPFTEAGMWGIFRVLPNTCTAGGTTGLICLEAPPVNTPASGTVTISDTTPTEDQALTVTPAIVDPDGVGPITFTWQAETAPGTWTTVGTGTTFTPGNAQVGQPLRVVASYTDLATVPVNESITSAATAAVANANEAPVGAPTLNAAAALPQENELITASTAEISDADGLVGVTFSFQWQQRGAGAFANIAGATSATFTPLQAQVGQQLRVVVSYTDNHGAAESVPSAETGIVGDVFAGTAGADAFAGTAGRDNASGLAGTDNLSGAGADDVLSGGDGNDTINGGDGNDTIIGGVGSDAINGGDGNDTIRFAAGFGKDTITGFDADPTDGQDQLDISDLGITAPTFATSVVFSTSGRGANTVVTIGRNRVTLLNVALAAVTSTDFVLAP